MSSHDPRSRAYCLARLFKSRIFSICVRSEGGPCRSVTLPQLATYKQWRSAAIDQQQVYVHMRNRADCFKTKVKPPPTNTWRPFNAQWKNPQHDQNAMDTSPGRTRARIAEAEDFLPGGNQYNQQVGGSREGGIPRGPVLLRFAKRCPTWTRIVWMQLLMT
jgi:hypothetical protein